MDKLAKEAAYCLLKDIIGTLRESGVANTTLCDAILNKELFMNALVKRYIYIQSIECDDIARETIGCNYGIISGEQIRQEALKREESCPKDMKNSYYYGFREGAKWMQKLYNNIEQTNEL